MVVDVSISNGSSMSGGQRPGTTSSGFVSWPTLSLSLVGCELQVGHRWISVNGYRTVLVCEKKERVETGVSCNGLYKSKCSSFQTVQTHTCRSRGKTLVLKDLKRVLGILSILAKGCHHKVRLGLNAATAPGPSSVNRVLFIARASWQCLYSY